MSFSQRDRLVKGFLPPGASGQLRAEVRERLIEANMDLVAGSVRRVGHGSVSLRSDLMQEGTIALIFAVDRFENQQDLDFPDYARQRIDRRIRRAIRRRARERSSEVNQSLETLADQAEFDPFSATAESETGRQAEALLKTLSKQEEGVLRLRFGIGLREPQTTEAVAERLGIQRGRVAFLEDRALSSLRRTARRRRKRFVP